jgi:hypothetical protein
MHAWGRGIDVLAMFSALTKGGNQWAGAFQPSADFPWIDQKIRLSMMIENGITYENSIGKDLEDTSTSRS